MKRSNVPPLLMLLPVLLLVVLGWVQMDREFPPRVIAFTGYAMPVDTPGNPDKGTPGDPDTQVHIGIAYRGPTFFKRYVKPPVWHIKQVLLTSDKGKLTKPSVTATQPEYDGNQQYGLWCSFPLAAIPKANGQVTLKGEIEIDRRWMLPFAVVVRDRDGHSIFIQTGDEG